MLPPEEPTCRLCWGAEDGGWGGELLQPCKCKVRRRWIGGERKEKHSRARAGAILRALAAPPSVQQFIGGTRASPPTHPPHHHQTQPPPQGSLQHIHRRCLREWQRTQRQQGLGRRAARCELCHAPYSTPPSSSSSAAAAHRRSSLAREFARSARRALSDASRAGAWPSVALRVWKAYVMASGVARALRVGAAGFAAGMGLGRALVEEQTALLGGVLASMNGLLGSPYAELLWAQAAGALLVGMASELLYCGVLGGLGGLAVGFAGGYVAAVRASAAALGRASSLAGSVAAWALVGAARRLLPVLPALPLRLRMGGGGGTSGGGGGGGGSRQ